MEKIHLKKLILHLWGGGKIQVGVFVRGEVADGQVVSGGSLHFHLLALEGFDDCSERGRSGLHC